jgi:cytochrome c553
MRILFSILTLCLALGFAQETVDLEAVAEGKVLYGSVGGIGCTACHGAYALGDLQIGPNIRGVDESRINGALEAAEEMGFLAPLLTPADISHLATYLQYLASLEPVSVSFRRSAFEPDAVSLTAGTAVQLIVSNGNRSDCTFVIDGADVEKQLIAGRATQDFIWQTPDEVSSLLAYCEEDAAATLPISVTLDAE